MNFAAFTSLLDIVRSDILDVRGCRLEERANEARRLRMHLDELCGAELARKNSGLEMRRRGMIEHATQTLVAVGL